jgi:hypothetical protein
MAKDIFHDTVKVALQYDVRLIVYNATQEVIEQWIE